MDAIAISNNDAVFIAWSVTQKIPGCIGFTVHRIENGKAEPLPAYVGFRNEKNPNWKPETTDRWPIQKFSWKDLFAQPGGVYTYKIIPLGGTSDDPQPLSGAEVGTTNPVTVSADCDGASVYFNRGLISTQATTRRLTKGKGRPSLKKLLERIAVEGDEVRDGLAGELDDALQEFLARKGTFYAALYELGDPVLIQRLVKVGKRMNVILANSDHTDKKTKKKTFDGGNAPARKALRGKVKLTDRFVGSGHIGHNKFVVHVGTDGKPRSVLTGSTNWTSTGLCTQVNNTIVLESATAAKAFLDQWKRLQEDTADGVAAGGSEVKPNSKLQGDDLRKVNAKARKATLDQGKATIWFSPNTTKRTKGKETPGDLGEVFEVIEKAQDAVLFLAFQPGSPSIVTKIKEVASAREQAGQPFFVRGALTDTRAADDFESTKLFHRAGDTSASVVGVAGVPEDYAFWLKELYKAGHAVIHDKIVVIDPLHPKHCVVVTGSHNLGFKASYANDENMVIIRGNQRLAQAYATHVVDVYDHFRWRWYLSKHAEAVAGGAKVPPKWSGLFKDTDKWQDRYFKANSHARYERLFWVGKH